MADAWGPVKAGPAAAKRGRPATRAAVLAVALALAGTAMADVAWSPSRGEPVASAGPWRTWRAAVADVHWLRGYLAWARRDPRATRAWLEAAVRTRPEALEFWLQGARVLAYDLPAWSGAGQAERRAAGDEALRWLERARAHHPRAAAPWIEAALVHLRRRDDPAAALQCLDRAAALPDAPAFLGTIRRELRARVAAAGR